MQTIFTIKVRFPTVSPLYCERTFHLANHADLCQMSALIKATPGWELVGSTINHLMSPKEIVDEIDHEIDMCLREAHVAASS